MGDLAPAPSGSCREKPRAGVGREQKLERVGPGRAGARPLTCWSLSMWARQSSRSLSPGTTTVPSGTAGGQSRPSAAGHPVCRPPPPPSAAPRHPLLRLALTGLLELLLVVMQGLVVVHADPAHLDPQLLGHGLLAEAQAGGERSGRVLGQAPDPGTLRRLPGAEGFAALSPAGETEARERGRVWPRAQGRWWPGGERTRYAGGRCCAAWPSAPWWPGCAGRCGCARLRACRARHPPALGWPWTW